jgi:glycosyltransferase involved in cell wall biosynthesis
MKFGALAVDFRPWSPDEQERALLECDIGLCPMPDTVWTRGKCPFKVLQYMAYGMPWVGSAVGENIITSGRNDGVGRERGVCAAESAGSWGEAILALVGDDVAREQMGRRGRAYVEATHDRTALVLRLESLWRGTVGGRAD